MSGVAGVYFEKILKSSRSSIWVINMQMSLLSAFFCTVISDRSNRLSHLLNVLTLFLTYYSYTYIIHIHIHTVGGAHPR